MERISLLLLTVFMVITITSCAREEAPTDVGVKEEGIMGPVLSKEKPAVKIAKAVSGNVLMVADFNNGTKPSNIGGDFGAWDRDPADFTQTCTDSFDSVHRYGKSGFGMKLDYDVDSLNPAYNGFWMKLNNLDASGFKNLAFFIKGDEDLGYTTVFKIELKSASGETGKFYATEIDSEWKKISIPLRQFQGITSFDNLAELVVVFEDRMATNKDGVIYIDDIQFTR